MTIRYGSFAYFLYIFIALGITAGLYFLLRKRSEKAKKITVFSLMLVNALQHFFKFLIWPHLWNSEFGLVNTVYNMCAFLIVVSPIIFLIGGDAWKNFITYVGSVAGMIAMVVPHWFVGLPAFSWEAIRFYFCHTFLFLTSILPALLGIYKINYRTCWKLPFLFFLGMVIIVFNDVICTSLGFLDGKDDLYGTLYSLNSVFIMHPPEAFPIMGKICAVFTPEAWESVPLLWLAIPMYLLISIASFGLGAAFDRGRFKQDFERFAEWVKITCSKIKTLFARKNSGDKAE